MVDRHLTRILLVLALSTLATLGFTTGAHRSVAEEFAVPPPRTVTGTLEVTPGYTQTALPHSAVAYTHVITNDTAQTQTLSLQAHNLSGWPVTLLYSGTASTVMLPLTVRPGLTATFRVSVAVPATPPSGTVAYTLITVTTALTDGPPPLVVTDTTRVVRVPGVQLSPAYQAVALPGKEAVLTHQITNTGPTTDAFALRAFSEHGWPVEVVDAAQQTLFAPLLLGELATATFGVRVTVPATAPVGAEEMVTIFATSTTYSDVIAVVTDTLVVRAPSKLFLPLIRRDAPPTVKLGVDFGVWITETDVISYDLPLVREMGATWVRVNISWAEIERTPGEYTPDAYDAVFDRLAELGLHAMATIYHPPSWAAEEGCGPISDTVAFENFMTYMLNRYDDRVDVWEFINEPDGREPYHYGPIIGCWGYHPQEYAQYLRQFYSLVKAKNPKDLVFFGGLAYDNWAVFARDFFTRTLEYGAGDYFDGLSLHYYPINPVEFPTIAHKIAELQAAMQRYGVHDKLVWVTETSMWTNAGATVDTQKDYILSAHSRGFAQGADNIFWFAVRQMFPADTPGYLYRWLINIDHQPDQGYYTYQHFAQQLTGLRIAGAYRAVPDGVEAYRFVAPDHEVYTVWTTDRDQATVTFPAAHEATLIDRDGQVLGTLTPTGGEVTVTVGRVPMYVVTR